MAVCKSPRRKASRTSSNFIGILKRKIRRPFILFNNDLNVDLGDVGAFMDKFSLLSSR